MKLSIIIPAYNEEKTIFNNLNTIIKYLKNKNYDYELIIVDDGSKDSTIKEVKKIKDKNLKLILNAKNKGKGFSVRRGMLASKGNIVLMSDADLSTPITELEKLMKFLNEYDIIIGSRALKESNVKSKWHKILLGRIGNILISLLAVRGIRDTQCGFKLFKRKCLKIFKKQTIERWGFDFELLFMAQKFGYRIKEVPVVWAAGPVSRVSFGSYPKTFLELLRIRWNDLCGKYK